VWRGTSTRGRGTYNRFQFGTSCAVRLTEMSFLGSPPLNKP
jgi:hypothetical protein